MYGIEPWCKGKRIPEHSARMKGAGNPMYGVKPWTTGRKHSKESIEKMREAARLREKRKTKEQQEAINRKISETKRKKRQAQ